MVAMLVVIRDRRFSVFTREEVQFLGVILRNTHACLESDFTVRAFSSHFRTFELTSGSTWVEQVPCYRVTQVARLR